jgi:membrane protease subunit (stomatin/prohibitin family)
MPDPTGVYACKFPESNLSTLSQMIVNESQEAVLFSKGKLIGKFGPGKHTLNTENLPLLRNLFGIPFGGNNPFTAEVWFVNKLLPLDIDWRTDGMMHQDPDYETMVPLVAAGRYGLRVDDAERFLVKLVGTASEFTAARLTDHFWGLLVSKTKSIVLQFMRANRVGIKGISAFLEPLSEALKAAMIPFWQDYGFGLIGFYVTSVEVDGASEAGRRILEAMARQSAQAIGGYSYQQSQVFEIAGKAVDSAGGRSGSGLLGALMMTSMLGSTGVAGVLQPPPSSRSDAEGAGQTSPTTGSQPPRQVFCSNCSKKFSSAMRFCPSCGDPYTPCPRCGADNDAKAARCVSCGAQLTAANICACGSPLPPGDAFCASCGRPVAGTGACSKCGFQADPKAAFCPRCGQKVER